jgi:hypothetical protein
VIRCASPEREKRQATSYCHYQSLSPPLPLLLQARGRQPASSSAPSPSSTAPPTQPARLTLGPDLPIARPSLAASLPFPSTGDRAHGPWADRRHSPVAAVCDRRTPFRLRTSPAHTPRLSRESRHFVAFAVKKLSSSARSAVQLDRCAHCLFPEPLVFHHGGHRVHGGDAGTAWDGHGRQPLKPFRESLASRLALPREPPCKEVPVSSRPSRTSVTTPLSQLSAFPG